MILVFLVNVPVLLTLLFPIGLAFHALFKLDQNINFVTKVESRRVFTSFHMYEVKGS